LRHGTTASQLCGIFMTAFEPFLRRVLALAPELRFFFGLDDPTTGFDHDLNLAASAHIGSFVNFAAKLVPADPSKNKPLLIKNMMFDISQSGPVEFFDKVYRSQKAIMDAYYINTSLASQQLSLDIYEQYKYFHKAITPPTTPSPSHEDMIQYLIGPPRNLDTMSRPVFIYKILDLRLYMRTRDLKRNLVDLEAKFEDEMKGLEVAGDPVVGQTDNDLKTALKAELVVALNTDLRSAAADPPIIPEYRLYGYLTFYCKILMLNHLLNEDPAIRLAALSDKYGLDPAGAFLDGHKWALLYENTEFRASLEGAVALYMKDVRNEAILQDLEMDDDKTEYSLVDIIKRNLTAVNEEMSDASSPGASSETGPGPGSLSATAALALQAAAMATAQGATGAAPQDAATALTLTPDQCKSYKAILESLSDNKPSNDELLTNGVDGLLAAHPRMDALQRADLNGWSGSLVNARIDLIKDHSTLTNEINALIVNCDKGDISPPEGTTGDGTDLTGSPPPANPEAAAATAAAAAAARAAAEEERLKEMEENARRRGRGAVDEDDDDAKKKQKAHEAELEAQKRKTRAAEAEADAAAKRARNALNTGRNTGRRGEGTGYRPGGPGDRSGYRPGGQGDRSGYRPSGPGPGDRSGYRPGGPGGPGPGGPGGPTGPGAKQQPTDMKGPGPSPEPPKESFMDKLVKKMFKDEPPPSDTKTPETQETQETPETQDETKISQTDDVTEKTTKILIDLFKKRVDGTIMIKDENLDDILESLFIDHIKNKRKQELYTELIFELMKNDPDKMEKELEQYKGKIKILRNKVIQMLFQRVKNGDADEIQELLLNLEGEDDDMDNEKYKIILNMLKQQDREESKIYLEEKFGDVVKSKTKTKSKPKSKIRSKLKISPPKTKKKIAKNKKKAKNQVLTPKKQPKQNPKIKNKKGKKPKQTKKKERQKFLKKLDEIQTNEKLNKLHEDDTQTISVY